MIAMCVSTCISCGMLTWGGGGGRISFSITVEPHCKDASLIRTLSRVPARSNCKQIMK